MAFHSVQPLHVGIGPSSEYILLLPHFYLANTFQFITSQGRGPLLQKVLMSPPLLYQVL